MATRVLLETGKTWTFASALDWPGWSRRGKSEELALEALEQYTDRYRRVAGRSFEPGKLRVAARVAGNATTDFGAPGAPAPDDGKRITAAERERLLGLLDSCWQYFDHVSARAPAKLHKGPRGGGRDRDAIVDHVREAERAYARKIGLRIAPRSPWAEQRKAMAEAMDATRSGGPWPLRHAIRRTAWHLLDHAWEIEDRS